MAGDADRPGLSGFAARVLVVLAIGATALFLWTIAHILLLAFGGILFAILLRRLAGPLSRKSGMPHRGAVALVVLGLAALLTLVGWLLGAYLAAAFAELAEQLPGAIEAFRDRLLEHGWARSLLRQAEGAAEDGAAGLGALIRTIAGAASVTVAALTGLIVVLFIGIYLAMDPGLYRRGLLLLVPERHRERLARTLAATGESLWSWLLGQFIAMVAVGSLTTIGLLLLGVPAAVALGIIAALLEFVPIVGLIAASVPAILLALAQDPMLALWTAGLYLLIQQAEGNLIMPLVQQRMAHLPPVIAITAILAFGLLFGFIGIFLATPLAIALMVWIRLLYVEGALGTEIEDATESR